MTARTFPDLALIAILSFYMLASWLDAKEIPSANAKNSELTARERCGNANWIIKTKDGKSEISCVPRKPLNGNRFKQP